MDGQDKLVQAGIDAMSRKEYTQGELMGETNINDIGTKYPRYTLGIGDEDLFHTTFENSRLNANRMMICWNSHDALVEDHEANRWKSVTEGLPDHPQMQSGYVQVTDGKRVDQAYYYDYTGREAKPGYVTGKGWYKHSMGTITHWRYIMLPDGRRYE